MAQVLSKRHATHAALLAWHGRRYAAYVMREVLSKRSEQFRITEVRGSAGPSAYGWGAGAGKMPPPGFAGEGSHA